jgi:hypothetical protein
MTEKYLIETVYKHILLDSPITNTFKLIKLTLKTIFLLTLIEETCVSMTYSNRCVYWNIITINDLI